MKTTMKQFEMHPMRLLAAACGLITLLALAAAAVAQQAAPAAAKTVASRTTQSAVAAKPAAKPAAEEETAAPNSAGNQGIKVHGHWVLQVKNADGTLGERREFDNSLVTGGSIQGGDAMIAGLISGNFSAGDPTIAFVPTQPGSADASTYCNWGINPPASTCYLFSTTQNQTYLGNMFGASYTQDGLHTQLTIIPYVSNPVGMAPTPATVNWVLSGNYTVPSGLTQIALVQTLYEACFGSVRNLSANSYILNVLESARTSTLPSASCTQALAGAAGYSLYLGTFTSTAVSGGPLAVTPGQIVQVTVTISFS